MKLTLDRLSGDVEIGDLTVGPSFSIEYLEKLKDIFDVKLVIKYNSGNSFYSVSNLNNGENSVLIFINIDGMIINVMIGAGPNYDFPPFTITEEEKMLVKKWIEMISGEREYPWGRVFYNEDQRGGGVSVTVSYRKLR